jgi:hypothetical protein
VINFATCMSAVLNNGLGRHDAALEAARTCFERDEPGHGGLVIAEAAEAASRSGDEALARAVLERMAARSRVTPTDWALGIEARIRGFLSRGDEAEHQYRESIARLQRTPLRVEQARAHLL